MRNQESDLHLGLYSSLTSANNLNLPTLLTLFYFSTLLFFSLLTSSSIVAVFIINWINRYPLDGAIGVPNTYPVDSAIQRLN